LLTPNWGPAGAALAASLLHPVGWLVALPAYRRAVGSLDLAGWVRPLAAAAAMVGVTWLFESLGAGTAWRLAAAASVYVLIAGRCWTELQQIALGRLRVAACSETPPDARAAMAAVAAERDRA
jgi:hypothetical protein